MDEAGSEWIWRAVRIITYVLMEAAIFFSALVLTTRLSNDFEYAIAGRDTVEWTDTESFDAPMAAVMLSNGGEEWMKDYIPLLGYVWWFGPLGFALFLVVALAIVDFTRYPRLPGSYLTPVTAAVGVAIALFGVAAAPSFVCVMYDDWAGCSLSLGSRFIAFNFVPLLLGSLVIAFAALFPRSPLLGVAAGGLLGLFIGAIALFPTANAYGLWWLPLLMAVIGAVAGFALSVAARRWRPDDRPPSGWPWVLFAAIVVVALVPVPLALVAPAAPMEMVMGVVVLASSLLLICLIGGRLTWRWLRAA